MRPRKFTPRAVYAAAQFQGPTYDVFALAENGGPPMPSIPYRIQEALHIPSHSTSGVQFEHFLANEK